MLDESVNAARARLATAERDFGAPKEPTGGAAARARAPDASSGSDSRGVLNAAQEHELQRLRDGAARALQAEEKEHVAALERLRHDGNVKAFDAKEEAEQQREQVRQDAREHVERWTKGELAQIEASTRPLRTPEDVPVTVHQTPVSAVPCGEVGSRLTVDLAFRTGDNAASATRILAAWDRAGYLPDRAMQEDIRYSTELPIERMSIRDSTSVDGMIHLTLESACAVAATP